MYISSFFHYLYPRNQKIKVLWKSIICVLSNQR
nr:MAG TPA: hypothetical protein [Microviridae sp.]